MICCFNGIDNLDNIFFDGIFEYAEKDGYLVEREKFDITDYFSYVIYNNEIVPTFSLYEDLYKNGNFKNIDVIVVSIIEEKRKYLYKMFDVKSEKKDKSFKINLSDFLDMELRKTLNFYSKILKNVDVSLAKFIIDFCLEEKKKQLFNFLGYEDTITKSLKKQGF